MTDISAAAFLDLVSTPENATARGSRKRRTFAHQARDKRAAIVDDVTSSHGCLQSAGLCAAGLRLQAT